ncbi:MAG: hypothetical protein AABY15_00460 [Nanoarchaeota archaeon]
MVILINFEAHPFKIAYKSGTRNFVKQFPVNSIVAMKDLHTLGQITNENFLTKRGVTIWHYESNTYMKRHPGTPTGTTLPLVFVGNDVKDFQTVSFGFSGETTISGMTLTANNIVGSTLFEFVTTADTAMVGYTSAATVGNTTYVAFNPWSAATTTNWYGAVSASTASAGITISGYGAVAISAATFYLSATTVEIASGYEFLSRLV